MADVVLTAGVATTTGAVVAGMASGVSCVEVTEVADSDVVVDVLVAVSEVGVCVVVVLLVHVRVVVVPVCDVEVIVVVVFVLLVVVVDVAEVVEVVDVVVAYRHLYSRSKQTNPFARLHKSALGSHSSFTSK